MAYKERLPRNTLFLFFHSPFYQFIHRDKTHKAIRNVCLLVPLAAF